jgi:hypothetical protein
MYKWQPPTPVGVGAGFSVPRLSPMYIALALSVSPACAPERAPPHRVERAVRERGDHVDAERVIAVVPRTPHLATFPCSEQCHAAREGDPTPRALTQFHAGRRIDHGPALGWCDRCHSIEDPDHLVTLDGATRVSFDASDQICAQCHGEKHRDWAEGVHGLNTGGWRGTVQRRLCTACHDPHAPGPLRFEALPPPELGLPPRDGDPHHDEEGS